jgi:hypothetical protein
MLDKATVPFQILALKSVSYNKISNFMHLLYWFVSTLMSFFAFSGPNTGIRGTPSSSSPQVQQTFFFLKKKKDTCYKITCTFWSLSMLCMKLLICCSFSSKINISERYCFF